MMRQTMLLFLLAWVGCADADGDGVSAPDDCDDGDAAVHPGATEVCNQKDDDCDGTEDADAADPPIWYADDDDDGFGDPKDGEPACEAPLGWVADGTDCDDLDPHRAPDQPEVCANGIDENCADDSVGCRWEGTQALSESPAILGTESGTSIGYHLLVADLDSDGADEVLVGAPAFQQGSCLGAVLISTWPLGADRVSDTTLPWRICHEVAMEDFGGALAVGDVNEDGVADLAVGAHGAAFSDSGNGAVYVFFGPIPTGSLTSSAADAVIIGTEWSHYVGSSVAIGDADDDGAGDLLIGTPTDPQGGTSAGAVAVFRGPLELGLQEFTDADTLITGATNEMFGRTLAAVGDIDGDGDGDFAVGNLTASPGGVVWVVAGPLNAASYHATEFVKIYAEDPSYFGFSLGAADLTGDGTPELLVGAPLDGHGATAGGAVYAFAGPFEDDVVAGPTTADFTLQGLVSLGYLGLSVVGGDFDADGAGDVFSSLLRPDEAVSSYDGSPRIWYAPAPGTTTSAAASVTFTAEGAGDFAGYGLAAGDLDGDGTPDLVVGAPEAHGGGGSVYLVHSPGE